MVEEEVSTLRVFQCYTSIYQTLIAVVVIVCFQLDKFQYYQRRDCFIPITTEYIDLQLRENDCPRLYTKLMNT